MTNLDLRSTVGLEAVHHRGPSDITTSTLLKSQGHIPDAFLRGCGLQDWEIENAKLYRLGLTQDETTQIANRTVLAKFEKPISFLSAFISYSHQDQPFARKLHDQLQETGIRCWRDEKDLKPGDSLTLGVLDAIRLNDKVLLCCSKTSLNSPWVEREIRACLDREIREGRRMLIPLNLDGYLIEGWESGLALEVRDRLAANFTGWENDNAKFEEQFEKVVEALRATDE